jgi:hypothetical protein
MVVFQLSLSMLLLYVGIIGVSAVAAWHMFAFLVVPSFPAWIREPVGRIWLKMTMWTWGAAIVVETDSGFDMVPFDIDAEHNAIEYQIDGEERKIDDKYDMIGYLEKRPFATTVDGVGSVVRPWVAAIGEDEARKVADGGHATVVEDADSGEMVFAHNPFTKVRDEERIVDMRNVMAVLAQLADGDLANRVQKRTQASLSGYSSYSDVKLLLAAGGGMAAGVGLTWLLLSTGGGGGGGGAVNVMIDLAGVLPV